MYEYHTTMNASCVYVIVVTLTDCPPQYKMYGKTIILYFKNAISCDMYMQCVKDFCRPS